MGVLLAKLCDRMPVAIMSGGSYAQFETQFLPALPDTMNRANLYLFPVSAGMCFQWKDGTWTRVYDHSFSDHERSAILHALEDAMEETGFATPPEQVWGERIEDRGAQITFSALGQLAPYEEKRKWDPDRSKRRPLQEALLRRLPDFSVRVNASTTIDITKQGVTKAFGVREWSNLIEVPIRDMLYVGDGLFPGGNDEVVKETGINTRQVIGPAETKHVIESFIG